MSSLSNQLKRAKRDHRLAAVHIDFQNNYYTPSTAAAFAGVRQSANRMRALNIPNIWVAFVEKQALMQNSIKSVRDMDRRYLKGDMLHPVAGGLSDETVILKDKFNAFEDGWNMPLDIHLDTLGIDTVLIDGVMALGCVSQTLKYGLLKDRFNFIAITDGMDLNEIDGVPATDDYTSRISRLTGSPAITKRRFSMTSLAELDEIFPAQKRQARYEPYFAAPAPGQ